MVVLIFCTYIIAQISDLSRGFWKIFCEICRKYLTAVCNENRKASAEAFERDVHAEDEAVEDILAEGGEIIAFKFL